MKKESLLFLLALLLIGVYSFWPRFQKLELTDVSHPETLALISEQKMVYALEVQVEGFLDDTAKIGTQFIGKGEVHTTLYSGDFYVDTFRIDYLPYKAKSGHLTLKYHFKTN